MSRFLRAKRSWVALAAVAGLVALAFPAASFADSGVGLPGCDFFSTAKNGTNTNLCLHALTPSTFAGGDGNLLVDPNSWGTTDWENVSGLNKGIDAASGTSDNSFGQGTKEDNAAVTTVSGSIPPNKSDLSRFYQASETVSGQTFLYLAWERKNVLGNANMDFEINKLATPNLGSPGPHTINRSPGDMLITFDFVNGGGRPVLGLNRWLLSATNPVISYQTGDNACLSANAFPCWGDHVTLTTDVAIGAVNNDAVTDPILTGSPNACPSTGCPALTFGETAINLSGAGVFGTGTCNTFASTFLKSRASASFPAEVKDFVPPVETNISNCGTVTIIKHTDPRGVNQAFSYDSDVTGTTTTTGSTACPTGSDAFSLNDTGNLSSDSAGNTKNCFNVPAGNYTVTEAAEPNGFVLESLSGAGTTGTGASCTQDAADSPQADIVVTPDSHVICTYTNQQQLGAILITKTSSKGAHPGLAGAVFSITGPNGYSNSVTTLSGGTFCVDGLTFGTYSVTETAPPTGYAIDDTSAQNVGVSANSTCGDGNEATFSATDTPLWDLQVRFRDGGSGATSGTISCESPTGTVLTPDTTATSGWGAVPPPTGTTNTYLGLTAPRTVTCTIDIDP